MPSWKKVITSGSAGSLSSLSLDTALPVSEGGTGVTTLTSNGILTGNGTSAIQAESNLTFNATNGNFSSGDGSESVTHEPSSNYLTVHETGASKGSHLRLSTDNSDYFLSAGGGINQLSIYDANAAANRLVVNSSGTFQFQQNVDVSGALTLGTALAVAEGGTGATSLTTDRVLTGNGTGAITAETNLSFNGSELGVTGGVDITGTYQTNNVVAINSDGNFEVHDNRATSGSTDLGLKGVRFDFKSNSADGLSDGGTYHGVMTFQQWNDTSGGHTHNLGFTDNGYIYHRNASIAGSWGNWKKLIQEDESGNVAIENGDLRATNDVIAFYSSDKRLKDNIVRIENPLEKIEKIGGYTFDWNDKQETYIGKDVGVIAQEIQEVLPELVTERDNGYLAVKYEKIVPLLIESIKELKQEVDEIKQKCDCLNN